MKKILVILTGGTIGSKVNNQAIDVDSQMAFQLIALFRKQYQISVEFEVLQGMNLLSENMRPKDWNVLCTILEKTECEKYSGIIITHGSDTLSYTSAFIGLAFHHFPIPIVMIAANYALSDSRSNGVFNFYSAVSLIVEGKCNGIFTVYSNSKGEAEVYLATRIEEADNYLDQFHGYGGVPYGIMRAGTFQLCENAINPTTERLNQKKMQEICQIGRLDNQIQLIQSYPGLNYETIQWKQKPKAILHCLYHSGTACVDSEEKAYSLPTFIERCKQNNIAVFLASMKSTDTNLYVSSKELLSAGAIPMYRISKEAAYAKLMLLYQQNTEVKQNVLQKDWYFEILDEMK